MDIVHLSFDDKLSANKNGVPVVLMLRKSSQYHNHVSFGIDAPRHIPVNCEKI